MYRTLACNYDESATDDDNSCVYAEDYYDCDGNCINDLDTDGVCDELEINGCTDTLACNYDENATDDDNSCVYAEAYYDCDANCLNDLDDDGICDELDNCIDVFNPNQDDLNGDGIGDDCDGVGLFENNLNFKLIKVFDILGREVNSLKSNYLYFKIREDGTVEKTIIIEKL